MPYSLILLCITSISISINGIKPSSKRYSILRAQTLFGINNALGVFFNGIQVCVVLYISFKYGGTLIRECEIDKDEDLRKSRMPFYRNATRRIDLREAKRKEKTRIMLLII
jgi:hypothetical protein